MDILTNDSGVVLTKGKKIEFRTDLGGYYNSTENCVYPGEGRILIKGIDASNIKPNKHRYVEGVGVSDNPDYEAPLTPENYTQMIDENKRLKKQIALIQSAVDELLLGGI